MPSPSRDGTTWVLASWVATELPRRRRIDTFGRPAAVAERKRRHERVLTHGLHRQADVAVRRQARDPLRRSPIQLEHEGRKVGNEQPQAGGILRSHVDGPRFGLRTAD
jgi:hypothetical protein